MTETAHDLVQKGAALLDVRLPGWADQIDLDTLELSNGCRCVLGQLAGRKVNLELLGLDADDYVEASGEIVASYEDVIDQVGDAVKLGFALGRTRLRRREAWEAWEALQDAWKGEIVARRTI